SEPGTSEDGAMGTSVSIDFQQGTQGERFRGNGDRNRLQGTNDNDTLLGKAGNDTLLGKAGNDKLKGSAGKDTLKGGKGDDRLEGGKDKDRLLGQSGNNILIGGKGNDFLRAGGGKDMLLYRNLNEGTDRVQKFDISQDVFDLSRIFRRAIFAGDSDFQRFTDYVQLVEVNGSTQVRVDADGSGAGTDTVNLANVRGVVGLSSQNFVLS
ncbi:MAG: type I secretion C-terminal target domain-containing protein, partial [Cyanobacteria bacterium J06627_8]